MKLLIRGIRKSKNFLYLIPGYLNGMIQMDLTTYEVQYIDILPKRRMLGKNLYEGLLVSDGLVWCSPYVDDQIVVYAPSNREFRYISLPRLDGRGRNLFRCGNMLDTGEDIIILPLEYPGILKVNRKNFEVTAVEWKERLYQKNKEEFIKRKYALSKDYEIVGDTIYLLDANYILKYDYTDDSIGYIQVCSDYKDFVGIVRFKDKFILLDRFHAELYEWTEETGVFEKINIDLGFGGLDTENEEGDSCPVGLIRMKDKVAVLLAASSYLYLIDEEYRLEKIALSMESAGKHGWKWHYVCCEYDGEYLYFPICYENKILMVNTDTWEQETIAFHLCEDDAEAIFENVMTAEEPLTENTSFYSLENFIEKLTRSETERKRG